MLISHHTQNYAESTQLTVVMSGLCMACWRVTVSLCIQTTSAALAHAAPVLQLIGAAEYFRHWHFGDLGPAEQ